MSDSKIALVIGSIRKESINLQLAKALKVLAPAGFTFHLVELGALPMYNQDEEMNPTQALTDFRDAIIGATAVLFVTPEYNRSIPGVLKNAIDLGSRPYGKSIWSGKVAGIIGASPGAIGTAVAQQHLRTILSHLNMKAMGQPEGFLQIRDGFFDNQGAIANPDSEKFLRGWIERYCAFVHTNS